MHIIKQYLIAAALLCPGLSHALNIATIDHGYYLSVMDCERKTPVAVIYQLSQDVGVAKRYASYIDDDRLKFQRPECHPKTDSGFKTYQSVLRSKDVKASYDVGHLAMSNHLDVNDESSKMANQFSNLAPQAAKLNRSGGAWYETELIIECHRDIEPLVIVAGTIDDPSTTDKDYFLDSFGQTTPDFWYRIVYWTKSRVYQAWIMPNDDSASREKLIKGEYSVGAEYLDSKLPVQLTILDDIRSKHIPKVTDEFMATKMEGAKLICRDSTTGLG